MKNTSWKWLIALILITILPAAAIYWFSKNNNFGKSASPPKMWASGLSSTGDTTYYQVPLMVAQNANGQEISTEGMNGNISVVEFFFTECQSICPIMNKQMARVFHDLGANKNLKIFSYTIDPERDDLDKLKLYADNHRADLNQWYFLHTPIDSVIRLAWSLKLPAGMGENALDSNDIPHSERFVVVDWDRNIRGYYNGTDSISINKMMNHIVLLMSEKDRLDRKKIKNEQAK